MFGASVSGRRRSGVAMVEAIITMIMILFAFLVVTDLSDLIRTKLFAESAAMRCARARSIGLNDFMLRKIARVSMMPVSGECYTKNDSGKGRLSYDGRVSMIGEYLNSDYEEQARQRLDFEYWHDGKTEVSADLDRDEYVTAEVCQRRKRLFDFADWIDDGKIKPRPSQADGDENEIRISAKATDEMHYDRYLQ